MVSETTDLCNARSVAFGCWFVCGEAQSLRKRLAGHGIASLVHVGAPSGSILLMRVSLNDRGLLVRVPPDGNTKLFAQHGVLIRAQCDCF